MTCKATRYLPWLRASVLFLFLLVLSESVALSQIKLTITATSNSATTITVIGSGSATTNTNDRPWLTDNGINQIMGNSSFDFVNSNLDFATFSLTGNLQLSDGVNPINFTEIVIDDDGGSGDYDDFALNVNLGYLMAGNTSYTFSGSATFDISGKGNFGDFKPGVYSGTFEGVQSGFDNFYESDIIIEVFLNAPAPTASNVAVSGNLIKGETLTGSYTYTDVQSDAESGTTFKWYRSDDGAGTNKTAIAGATTTSYTLVQGDVGKFISFEVTPSDGTHTGSAAESTALESVTERINVQSIVRQNPSMANITATIDPVFRVTFSEEARNVTMDDFIVSSTAGGEVSAISTENTSTYDITVSNLNNVDGTLSLKVKGIDGAAGTNNITATAFINGAATIQETGVDDYLNQAKIGQTFTATTNNFLTAFTLFPEAGQHDFSGTATLEIYSGDETAGGATVLKTQTVKFSSSTAAMGQTIHLTNPPQLTSGQTYSIVLTNFTGTGSHAFSSNTGGSYSGGHVIFTSYNSGSHGSFDFKIDVFEGTKGDGPALLDQAPDTNESYTVLVNEIPVVSNLAISGVFEVGSTLSATYTFTDADVADSDASTYQWYRADDASGTNAQAIIGATNQTYTVLKADNTKFISFEVTPNDGKANGAPVEVSFTEVVNRVPTFTSAPITAIIPGDDYAYEAKISDADGDEVTVTVTTKPSWLDVKTTTEGKVTSIAGGPGSSGRDNGTGFTNTSFNIPKGVAVDAEGNIYVADERNQIIRKVTRAGVVSNYSGTGCGETFSTPQDLVVDAMGNIYVTDTGARAIFKLTNNSGTIVKTRFAGGGSGSVDGTGTGAGFSQPTGIAIDSNGNLYVADMGHNIVRVITPNAVVTTLLGNGSAGFFNQPYDVAVDDNDNVYVTENGSSRISKVTGSSKTTLAGGGTTGFQDGTGSGALFKSPKGITIGADGNLYVTDEHAIRKVTPIGVVTTIAGSANDGQSDGIGAAASLDNPTGIAFFDGELFFSDTETHIIRSLGLTSATKLSGSSTGQIGSHPVVIQATDGKGGVTEQSFSISFGSAPVASDVNITGTQAEGATMSGTYTYFDDDSDVENGSTFKWYLADDASGTNKAAIAAATAQTYMLTAANQGKYLSFEVTPNDGFAEGTPVESTRLLLDFTPPEMVSATQHDNSTIYVAMSEPIDPIVGTATSDFTLVDSDNNILNVTSVSSGSAGNAVLIIQVEAPLPEDTDITITYQKNDLTVSDLTGNDMASDATGVVLDLSDPEVTITSDATNPQSGAFTATFTFSEGVTGFDASDIAVSNAAVSNFASTSTSVYTATITPQADGAVTVDVAADKATDAAGNNNTAAAQVSLTNDETAPAAPTVGAVGVDRGDSNSDFITNDQSLIIGGQAEANSTVEVFIDNVSIGTTTTNSATTWLLSHEGTDLAAGTYSITAKATDAAGNTSSTSTAQSLQIDLTVPTVDITSDANDPQAGAFTATFTFSEAVSGFTSTDITVTNAAVSNFNSTSAKVYTATITPTADGQVIVSVVANKATDIAGNSNSPSNQLVITNDQTAPTVTITSDATNPQSGAFTATFTFSEAVTGFDASDIAVSNAAVSNFASTSTSAYTATITPQADGAVTVDVAADKATDAAGNNNTTAAQLSLTNDETAPAAPTVGAVGVDRGDSNSDFITNDQSLIIGGQAEANSTVEVFIDNVSIGTTTTNSATTWLLSHEGTDLAAGTYSITAKAKDAAGNTSATSAAQSLVIDLTVPTVTITTDATSPQSGVFTATFTFSENVSGFTSTDITVTNAAVSNFNSSSAKVYTATITPTADGQVIVSVVANKATDIAGNSNSLSNQLVITNDQTAPTVTLTSDATNPQSGAFTATFTFSEAVTGFDASDIAVSNAAVSNFASTSTSVYTATITPQADGAVTVDVAADKATDAAGNNNTTAAQLSLTNDETAPAAPTVGAVGDDRGSFNSDFITNDQSLVIGGLAEANSRVEVFIDNVSIGTTTTNSATTWLFSHEGTDLAAGTYSITAKATDAAGNTSSTSTAQSLQIDLTVPTVDITSDANDPQAGVFTATFTFSEAVSGFTSDDITVSNAEVSNFNATSTTIYTATITPSADGLVTVDVNASIAQDLAGNNNTAATQLSLTNDETAPTVLSAVKDSETQITLTFSEVVKIIDADASNFIIKDGNSIDFSATGLADGTANDNQLVLTVSDLTAARNSLTITYGALCGDISDLAGNALANDVTGVSISLNQAPVATNVAFSGVLEAGETLTGTYTYTDNENDTESGSTYQWYTADDAAGSNKTSIPTGTAQTYVLTSSELGKFVSFEVTPNDGALSGISVESTRQGTVKTVQTISFGALTAKTFGETTFDLTASTRSNLSVTYSSSNTNVATVTGSTVTIVGAGSTDITASQSGNASYKAANDVVQSLTINKAVLMATADDKNKAYGEANPTFTVSYSGFVNGNDVTDITEPTASTTATATSDAGTYDITLTGGSATNYSIVNNNGALTIDKVALTATADDQSRAYGEENPAFTISYAGFVNGDDATDITAPTAATTATVSSDVGNYDITLTGGTATNYSLAITNGSLTVNKATLTATADDKSRAYGEENPALTITYTGFLNGDNATDIVEPTITTNANATSAATIYEITLSGGSAANYSITNSRGLLTVGKAVLTATADDKRKAYTEDILALTISYSGFVNGDNMADITEPTASTTATATSDAGTYDITLTGGFASNYSIVNNDGTLTIDKAVLTATADNQSRTYGDTNPVLTISYSGFVNGDNVADITEPTASTTATATSDAGTYDITLTGGVATNYSLVNNNGSLTVSRAALTATADDKSRAYGEENPALTITYTGFLNGDDATDIVEPTITTNANATSAAIVYKITLSGGSAANYSITNSRGLLTVGKAVLTATADDKRKAYTEANPTLTISYAGFANGDDATDITEPTASTTATTTSDAGTYDITLTGGFASNYSIVNNDGTLTIDKAVLTATADNQSLTYGNTNPVLTTSYAGFVNGDDVADITEPTASTTATATSDAGTYDITLAGGFASNYSIVNNDGTLTIDKAVLTATADNQNRTYGDTNPVLTISYAGFVKGDDVSDITEPTASTTAAATSDAGTYDITLTGGTATNYSLINNNGSLTVNKATLTATADGKSKAYGEGNPALTISYAGFVNGDDATDITEPTLATTADISSPAGNYDITLTGGSATNYSLTNNTGTLSVTQAVLTAVADDQQKSEGQTNPELTIKYSGFVNGEDENSISELPIANTIADENTPSGQYPISLSGGSDDNYELALVDGVLTVNPLAEITSVSLPATGTYGIGDQMDFEITWSQPVTIMGSPAILLTIGDKIVEAELQSQISNGNTASFRYTVEEDDLDQNGIILKTAIELKDATIIDGFGVDALIGLNTVGSTSEILVDGVKPIAMLSTDAGALVNGVFTLTITYDESITDFDLSDIVVSNGTPGNLLSVRAGQVWTADITPLSDGEIVIDQLAGSVQDIAGNENLASNRLVLSNDETAPAVVLSAGPAVAGVYAVTAQFSETVSSFTQTDIIVTGGAASSFTAVDGDTYTFSVSSTNASAFVDIAVGVSTDAAGNGNTAATQLPLSFNSAPTDIGLSANSLDENNDSGATVGDFSTTDADASDIHSYTLVSGAGDTDNTGFTIDGINLKAAESFNFETKSSYSIRVKTDDGRGGTFEKSFSISINNVAEPEIEVTGNVNFTETQLGITVSAPIIITNVGEASTQVIVSSVPTGFSVTPGSVTLMAGESKEVNVNFTPSEETIYAGELVLAFSGREVTLSVSGIGAIITAVDDEFIDSSEIKLYPNPASQILNIDLSQVNAAKLDITIINAAGVRVYGIQDYRKQRLSINVGDYNNGMYIMQFTDGKSVARKKVIIRK